MTSETSESTYNRTQGIIRNAWHQIWSASDKCARRCLAGSLICMLGSSLTAALAPVLLKTLVDTLDENGDHIPTTEPLVLILAYAWIHYSSRALAEARSRLLGRAEQRICRQLSDRYFRHIISLPLRIQKKRKTGAVNQILTNGLFGYRTIMLHLVSSVVPLTIEALSMGVILALLGHEVFLVVIGASISSYTLVLSIGAKKIHTSASTASVAQINAGAILADTTLNFETVKTFNGESQARLRYLGALKNVEKSWDNLYMRRMRSGMSAAIICSVSLGLSMYIAANGVLQGTVSVGDFVLVNSYVIQLVRPLESIGFAFRDITQGISFIEEMMSLFRERPESRYLPDQSPVSSVRGDLTFDRVSFGYEPNRKILRDISFSVPYGKTLAIVGPSGSGKSSITRLLLRLIDPGGGYISMGGLPISKIPLRVLRDLVAVVPQDATLFNETIDYNIAFGSKQRLQTEIVKAARAAVIHDFILGLPDGYETMVGERGINLSGGEKQRLAIARAIIRKPDIFIFDEATSALDAETERTIWRNLTEISQGAMVILIAHRLSAVINADEILVLANGRIVERGVHDVLLEQGSSYALLWNAQQERAQSAVISIPFDSES